MTSDGTRESATASARAPCTPIRFDATGSKAAAARAIRDSGRQRSGLLSDRGGRSAEEVHERDEDSPPRPPRRATRRGRRRPGRAARSPRRPAPSARRRAQGEGRRQIAPKGVGGEVEDGGGRSGGERRRGIAAASPSARAPRATARAAELWAALLQHRREHRDAARWLGRLAAGRRPMTGSRRSHPWQQVARERGRERVREATHTEIDDATVPFSSRERRLRARVSQVWVVVQVDRRWPGHATREDGGRAWAKAQ